MKIFRKIVDGFLGMLKAIRVFISEVRGELFKAQWPWDPNEKGIRRYRELFDSTKVVIIAMLLLGGYIAFCDLVLVQVFGSITHRQKTEQVAPSPVQNS